MPLSRPCCLFCRRNHATHIEDLEAGNIEHTDEHGASLASLECHVTLPDEPREHTREETLGHGTDVVVDSIDAHTLGDELGTDLDLGLAEVPVELLGVNTEQFGNNFSSLWKEEKGNKNSK